ncbi:myrosinase 4-like [Raphanus sativus]|uniref:thioglucosidase n=1 Tax=Raphanus sativus TaxID=3726 RepID=A0A9W3D802_RAPSA|nr:myrosinase 4-like [Raphanus sativus]
MLLLDRIFFGFGDCIEPYVTIFHWDVPQTLEDEYGGFLSRRIVEDVKNYADLLFQRFGDRVKFWITLNQPYSLATKGYGDGSYPPGRCTGCEFGGNSGTEPYIVAHNQLLAHAQTVALYRKRYQKSQGGKIGTTLIGRWFTPLNENSIRDKAAAKRAFDFFVGWFLDPLVYGRYPKIMRQMVGHRLPIFTPQELKLVKGSLDFLGLNYYVTQYATNAPPSTQPSVITDSRVTIGFYRNGVPIGVQAPSFVYYPPGFRQILNYIKNNYGNPLTYITENGVAHLDTGNLTLPVALADNGRIQNHCSHLSCLKCAIE